jgi:hypothetical protein
MVKRSLMLILCNLVCLQIICKVDCLKIDNPGQLLVINI